MDYEILNEYQIKVEHIKTQLDEFIAICRGELQDEDNKGKNKQSTKYLIETLEYRVRVKLGEILRQERSMSNDLALKLTAEQIYQIYTAYLSLISYINTAISYTPNKLEFLAFARISVSAFAHLLENSADDVKQVCGDIEADLINFTLSAAEQGQVRESSSKMRLKSKGGYGHALVQIGDVYDINKFVLSGRAMNFGKDYIDQIIKSSSGLINQPEIIVSKIGKQAEVLGTISLAIEILFEEINRKIQE